MTRRTFLAILAALPAGLKAAAATAFARAQPAPAPANRGSVSAPGPRYHLFWGGNRTGKTDYALRQVLDHCRHNADARAVVICRDTEQMHVLADHFERILRNPIYANIRQVDYMALTFDRCWFWVLTVDGVSLSSRVDFIAPLLGDDLGGFLRNTEPSCIFVPSLEQHFNPEQLFYLSAQQLGRRRGIAYQPFFATHNHREHGGNEVDLVDPATKWIDDTWFSFPRSKRDSAFTTKHFSDLKTELDRQRHSNAVDHMVNGTPLDPTLWPKPAFEYRLRT